jgi:diamine N-acetyltransferase
MSTANIHIRHAEKSDNLLLAEFGRQAFIDSFAADNRPEDMQAYLAEAFNPAKQAEEIADPASVFFIAEIEGQVAGYARLQDGAVPGEATGRGAIELVRIYAAKNGLERALGRR